MTTYTFKPAQRTQSKLRLAIAGPPNAGKTFTSLMLARFLGRRLAVIDSERGSSQKYAGEPELPAFDVLTLESFSPEDYLEAIRVAVEARYEVVIIDSLSHAWTGTGGILEIVARVTAKSKSQNPFTEGWRAASPLHNRLVDTLLQAPVHLICTLRTKTEYVMQTVNGRQQPKEIGTEPIQRAGLAYEFDLVGEMDKDNLFVVTKTRCRALFGKEFLRPGAELATIITSWLQAGAPGNGDTPSRPVQPAGHGLGATAPSEAATGHAPEALTPAPEVAAPSPPPSSSSAAAGAAGGSSSPAERAPTAAAAPSGQELLSRPLEGLSEARLRWVIQQMLKHLVPGEAVADKKARAAALQGAFDGLGWTKITQLSLEKLRAGTRRLQLYGQIQAELARLSPGDDSEREDYLREAFGGMRWAEVLTRPTEGLEAGLAILQRMRREVPPASELPGPAPAEADEAVDDLPPDDAPEGEGPPETPEIGTDGYVAWGDVETVKLWSAMLGQATVVEDLLKVCPPGPDGPLVTPTQYARLLSAVRWATAHATPAEEDQA